MRIQHASILLFPARRTAKSRNEGVRSKFSANDLRSGQRRGPKIGPDPDFAGLLLFPALLLGFFVGPLSAQTVPPPGTRHYESGWRPASLTEPVAAPAGSAAPANAFSNGAAAPAAPLAPFSGAPAPAAAAVAPTTATGGAFASSTVAPPSPSTAIAPLAAAPAVGGARVSNGNGTLPNEQGQIWREYDITPYTRRVTSTERPEQALEDWILRETGYEAWHGEPLAILSASRTTLRVYHTPAMQAVVKDLVDRFVSSEAESYTFSLRVMTLEAPDWRIRVQRLLRPVTVQTPGVQAWLLEKEEAAALLAELQRRSDFREHTSANLMVNNGQGTLVSAMRGRPYVRDLIARSDTFPGYESQPGQLDEGFVLDFSPLLSLDRQMIDATIKCEIDQVEKLVPVVMDVPTPSAPRQRGKLEVPQVVEYRFHERFRWPASQVLLVSLGIVPSPVPVDGKASLGGIALPFGGSPPRAELLVLVDCRGPSAPTATTVPGGAAESSIPTTATAPGTAPTATPTSPLREAKNYRGRY